MDGSMFYVGSIKLRLSALVHTTIENANMEKVNGRHTPFAFDTELHAPTSDDTPMTEVADSHRQLLVDMWYLDDCTRPDVALNTGKLTAAVHKPKQRH